MEAPILHTLIAVFALIAHACAALPVIAVLTLVSARRGNGQFCIWGATNILITAIGLAPFGPLWLFLAYWAEVAPYNAPAAQALRPLLEAAGLPWSSSFIAWLLACGFMCAGYFATRSLAASARDSCPLKILLPAILLNLASALAFFLVQVLIHWPFAGFPPGIEESRAVMAIARNAMRTSFMGFCQAGALCLVLLPFMAARLDTHHLLIAVRWFGFWAVAGCLPHIMVTWGASIGIGLRSPAAFSQSLIPGTIALSALTAALGCWAFLLWKPQYFRFLAPVGAMLLLIRTILPVLLRIF